MAFNLDYVEDAPNIEQIEVLTGNAVIEFGTPWCEFCLAAKPFIKEVLTEASKLDHIKVYDGRGKRLGRAFQVKLWPTLIALNNGQEIARVVRPTSIEEIRQMLAMLK